MPLHTHDDLPDYWSRQSPTDQPAFVQLTLWSTHAEELLAELKVSTSDIERWHRNGWISFRVHEHDELNGPQEAEVRFISPIARSGLTDSQITHLLKELRSPYSYSDAVAYHFKYGWVTPTHEDAFDAVSSNINEWLIQLAEEGDTERLSELADAIHDLLNQEEKDGNDDVSAESEGYEEQDSRTVETTIGPGPLKFVWHELSEIPSDLVGHGIELHDTAIADEDGECRMSETSLVGFVEGFGWRHGASNDVVAYCITPNSRTSEAVLSQMKQKVEELLSMRKLPLSQLTLRIGSRVNG